MKRFFQFFISILILVSLVPAGYLFAGSLDNNNNHSAEYARMGARQGSVDSADAAVYNPAGTVRLSEGLHAAIYDQIILFTMGHEYGGKKYEATGSTLIYPTGYLIYRSGDISVFLGYTVAGGIGDVTYEDGIYILEIFGSANRDINAVSLYHCGIIGAAYSVNDIISVSLGARGIYSYYEVNAGKDSSVLSYRDSAKGAAPVFGINIIPLKELNIGIRYEAEVNLEYHVDRNEGTPIVSQQYPKEGSSFHRDLPALLSAGIAYMLFDNSLKLAADFDYVFNKNARWTDNLRNVADEDKYNNSYEVRVGAEYAVLEILKVSAGYHHGNPGADKDSYPVLGPKMPFNGVSCGAMYQPVKDVYINAGISRFIYDDVKDEDGIGTYKNVWLMGIGVQAKIF